MNPTPDQVAELNNRVLLDGHYLRLTHDDVCLRKDAVIQLKKDKP